MFRHATVLVVPGNENSPRSRVTDTCCTEPGLDCKNYARAPRHATVLVVPGNENSPRSRVTDTCCTEPGLDCKNYARAPRYSEEKALTLTGDQEVPFNGLLKR
ncbi:UNVERIFIED_CONTAM: hypothetical protein FKN15_003528 [Acipenser sinensis]